MPVCWTQTQVSFSRYSCPAVLFQFHPMILQKFTCNVSDYLIFHLGLDSSGLWYNRRIVPENTTEGCTGTVPVGELHMQSEIMVHLILCRKLCARCWCFCFVNSGCSCLTWSSAHSWCCRRLHTWTTEPHASAIVTSLKLVMSAPFVCQVSAIPN